MGDTYGSQGGQGAPAGIPQIPAGAQLGGEGYAQNQQAYQQQQLQQPQQPHQPQHNPLTAGTYPQPPVNPLQNNPQQQPMHPQVQQPTQQPTQQPNFQPQEPPKQPLQSNESLQSNPYNQNNQNPQAEAGADYIETSINYLSAELGVSADAFDAVIENAIKHGDVSLINPHALGKDLTPEQSTRVQQLAQTAVQAHQQGVANAKAEAYRAAGSEAAWNNAISAFNANAPEDLQGYAAYLADSDVSKAVEFVLNYTRQNGYVNQQQQPAVSGGVAGVTHGISQAEYAAEISKIEREAGNRSLGSPEFAGRINALNAQRQLGRRQGR